MMVVVPEGAKRVGWVGGAGAGGGGVRCLGGRVLLVLGWNERVQWVGGAGVGGGRGGVGAGGGGASAVGAECWCRGRLSEYGGWAVLVQEGVKVKLAQ